MTFNRETLPSVLRQLADPRMPASKIEDCLAEACGALLAENDALHAQLAEVRRALIELRDQAKAGSSYDPPSWRRTRNTHRFAAFDEALALLPEVES